MHIEHVAIWTRDLETLKAFYEMYFEAQAGPKYHNSARAFESYFLTFPAGGRLELMRLPLLRDASGAVGDALPCIGYAHIAFAVGSVEGVDELTAQLAVAGYQVVSGPRRTGDGYYESCVLDPDGNRVEITV